MKLTNPVVDRIVHRMHLDGFPSCSKADVWKVYETGDLDGQEILCSQILNEFDEYSVEVPQP